MSCYYLWNNITGRYWEEGEEGRQEEVGEAERGEWKGGAGGRDREGEWKERSTVYGGNEIYWSIHQRG